MFTSISKRHKVQVLYYTPEIHTADLNKLRNGGKVEDIANATRSNIDRIVSLTPKNETNNAIKKYFPDTLGQETEQLSILLQHFPHVFHDLIRIVSEYRTFYKGRNSIQKEDEARVAEAFLFENRPEDVGPKIPGFVKLICNSHEFITYAEKQHSLLDISYYGFTKIPGKERKQCIKELIRTSLIENIPGITPYEIKNKFGGIRERILFYLKSVYGVDTSDFLGISDIDTFAEKINASLNSKHANKQKVAWKILQAFYAWGEIEEIEEKVGRLNSEGMHLAISDHIERKFGKVLNNSSEERDGTTIWNGVIYFKGKKIDISWRIKSVPSILMKTKEDPDYGYTQSIRDNLGISLTFPDDTTESDIQEVMSMGSSLLSENGYILKNKGLLSESAYNQLFYDTEKHPLFGSTESGGDPKMINASQSGFTGIVIGSSRVSLGCEIQYARKSVMEWKKRENAIYKFKSLFKGLLRGEYIDTPQSVYDSIKQRITIDQVRLLEDPDTRENLGLRDHKDLMLYLVQVKNILIPYGALYKGELIVMITTEFHENGAKDNWKLESLKDLDARNPGKNYHQKFMQKINELGGASLSTKDWEGLRIDKKYPGMFAQKGGARPMK